MVGLKCSQTNFYFCKTTPRNRPPFTNQFWQNDNRNRSPISFWTNRSANFHLFFHTWTANLINFFFHEIVFPGLGWFRRRLLFGSEDSYIFYSRRRRVSGSCLSPRTERTACSSGAFEEKEEQGFPERLDRGAEEGVPFGRHREGSETDWKHRFPNQYDQEKRASTRDFQQQLVLSWSHPAWRP